MSNDAPQACPVPTRLCEHPVFVVGSPRSGTSILARSLSEHSQLWSSDETQFMWDLFYDDRVGEHYKRGDLGWLRRRGVEKAEFLSYLGIGLNALLTEQAGGRRWVDSTPIYTLIIDRIAAMFPGALFLHILRDGRSVVHSMINYLNIYPGDPSSIPWASDFEAACRAWSGHVQKAMEFTERRPDRCLTVPYEALVAHPEDEFRRIFQFLRTPDEAAPASCLSSTRINSSFQGSAQATSNGRPDPWSKWTPQQRETFLREAGPVQARYVSAPVDDAGAALSA
jgi:hypothetical protein